MIAIDGYQLYGFFRAGSRRVYASRKHLDDINVFPVPDGDTGTNLSSTLAGTVDATVPDASASTTLIALADAALVSARGNSGVIFAQFISGLSEVIVSAEMKSNEFADAVRHAYHRAKDAITNPRDGTMISVIEDWASSLARRINESSNLVDLIGSSRGDLRVSLASTTERLAELKAAGVIDAGAAGFVEFIEGGHDFLVNGVDDDEMLQDDSVGGAPGMLAVHQEAHLGESVETPRLRYCTEAIVTGPLIDAEAMRARLSAFGDSLIVASGRKRTKIHVHTNDPEGVMESLSSLGTLGYQKVDDMQLQYDDAHNRVAATAIVTDTACDLPLSFMERHRIHAVPLLLSAGGSEYLDKLTLSTKRLSAIAEGHGVFPKTAQPPAHFFSRLYSYLGGYYEGVVAVHVASALSGTFDTSRREAQKANEAGGRVRVVDSRHLSGSLGLLVLRAAIAAEAGASADDIARDVPTWSSKARILVSVTSLRYMVKGGRVSPLKGLAAKLLNLKPIVSVDETGASKLYGKSFSEKKNLATLVSMASDIHKAEPLLYYAVGHTGASEKAAAFAAALEAKLGFPPLYITDISSVVALNAGPGAVSVVTMSA